MSAAALEPRVADAEPACGCQEQTRGFVDECHRAYGPAQLLRDRPDLEVRFFDEGTNDGAGLEVREMRHRRRMEPMA